jgi:CBS domain-containing protein
MFTVKEVMTTDVVTVQRNTPIFEAMKLMALHDISGLPVVENDMTLVGVLSEKDVLALVYHPEYEYMKRVRDFMTEPAFSFQDDASLTSVAAFLMKNVFRRVPIVSGQKLVGIVSVRDILEHLIRRKFPVCNRLQYR